MSKRIQDLTPPVTKWRKRVSDAAWKPFKALSADQRFWIGFVFLCLVTALLVFNPFKHTDEQTYKEGDIARESIIAPADIFFTDDRATASSREDARSLVKPIFRFESNNADQAVQQFLSSWEKLQRHGSETSAKGMVIANATSKNVDTARAARLRAGLGGRNETSHGC